MTWTTYDPSDLAALARAQHPGEAWLPAALEQCTRAMKDGRAYLYFVEPDRPNEPDSAWQFERNLTLEHPREGTLVLDVLRGGRIGGVEFLSRL